MVKPSSSKKKGAWTKEEDNKLRNYVQKYGHWNWRLLPKFAGLERCGKSCRLRWMNYLKPGLKKGNFTKQEKDLLIKLHQQLGNKWSTIAAKFPGRTDNDIKNFWHAHIQKDSKRKSAKLSKEHTDESSTNERLCMENQEISTYEDGKTHDNQISFWTEPFYSEDYCLSPLPEVNYSELSSFGSTFFSTTLDWNITDDQDHSLLISSNQSAAFLMQEDFWHEPFVTDAFQGENSRMPEGGFHDHPSSSLYFGS